VTVAVDTRGDDTAEAHDGIIGAAHAEPSPSAAPAQR